MTHLESPPPSPATPPLPFAPAPRRAADGCGKAALIGCGALLLLLGIGGVVLVLKAREFLRWGFERVRDQVVAGLPDDVPADERQRFARAFAAAVEQATFDGADPADLVALQDVLRELGGKSGNLTREELRELTEHLERVAGIAEDDEDQEEAGEAVAPAESAAGP